MTADDPASKTGRKSRLRSGPADGRGGGDAGVRPGLGVEATGAELGQLGLDVEDGRGGRVQAGGEPAGEILGLDGTGLPDHRAPYGCFGQTFPSATIRPQGVPLSVVAPHL